MNPVDVISRKRDGEILTDAEIEAFVRGFVAGDIPDYQVAAWAMAVYFQGMNAAETTALTLAMAASGAQLDLHTDLPAGTVIVDKHSSGGIGDKTTLAVTPIVAACGLPVGKMSGRGLGFTGGTIDKLESIPGWSPDRSDSQFRQQLREIGLVVAGQTADLAPADKELYALRDVTGTVASLPLIASSIMSKKLAADSDAIVLDVKCGRGAFMESRAAAHELAQLMVDIGTRAGRRVTALITQMEQPLGNAVGNSLEVREAIETLRGAGPADFGELVEAVAAEMLRLGGIAPEQARLQVRNAVASGAALEKFRQFIAAQGGDPTVVDAPERLPTAPVQVPVAAPEAGAVQRINAREIGLAVVGLGGGRRKKGDPIDHRVGVICHAKVGDTVVADDALCTVHAADDASAAAAVTRIRTAYTLGAQPIDPLPVIYDRISTAE